MIKLKDLLEKSMLAGRHDEKETLEIVRDMSKNMAYHQYQLLNLRNHYDQLKVIRKVECMLTMILIEIKFI